MKMDKMECKKKDPVRLLLPALFPIMPPEAVVVKDLRSCAVRQERRE